MNGEEIITFKVFRSIVEILWFYLKDAPNVSNRETSILKEWSSFVSSIEIFCYIRTTPLLRGDFICCAIAFK